MWHRRFRALDGEALAGEYCLLGTDSEFLYKPVGALTTAECFDFIYQLVKSNPGVYWIGYGIGYDVENIVASLSDDLKDQIFDVKLTAYGDIKIRYLPKKIFEVRFPGGVKFTWYDAIGFCQTSFVLAYEKITGKKVPGFVSAGKEARGTFERADRLAVLRYNRAECRLLIEMMQTLDTLLQSQGIKLRRFYGASCIADYLLNSIDAQNLKQYFYTEEMNHAFKCAYFGGRIEALQLGTFHNVYNYDINSAYPFAAVHLPKLEEWIQTKILFDFGVYKVHWDCDFHIGLLPWRREDGAIFFPKSGTGWYWSPELRAIERLGGQFEILEGYTPDYHSLPFDSLIYDLYNRRRRLKEEGNNAELVIKLGLNALYGKLAQHTGKARYFNLPYAGLITSTTRAMLLLAVAKKPQAIIGFSTDGILSREPLALRTGPNLGEWSESFYKTATVLMPGVYRLDGQTDTKLKRRGFKVWNWDKVIEDLNAGGESVQRQNVFIGHKVARQMWKAYGPHYLKFIELDRKLNPYHLDKRRYDFESIKDWNEDSCGSQLISGFSKESAEIDWSTTLENEETLCLED